MIPSYNIIYLKMASLMQYLSPMKTLTIITKRISTAQLKMLERMGYKVIVIIK